MEVDKMDTMNKNFDKMIVRKKHAMEFQTLEERFGIKGRGLYILGEPIRAASDLSQTVSYREQPQA